MKKPFLRVISVFTAVLLAVCPMTTAFAATARVIESDDEKTLITQTFNTAVNAIKSESPYAVLTNTSAVPEDGIITGSDGRYQVLDEEVAKYLIPVLDGLFKSNSSVTKSFILTLLGEKSVASFDKIELHRGSLRNSLVPLYGENYVSALALADDYQLTVFENDNNIEEILVTLPGGVQLKDADKTSYPKLFSLPSGSINPVVLSGANTSDNELLKDCKFSDFELGKAAVRIALDENGKVTRYRSQIDYNFKLSFYDIMQILTAVMHFNFLEVGVSLANTILTNLGQEGVSAQDILKSRELTITYTASIEISDFNWEARYFGDIDDDGEVSAADARAALRHSVALDLIKRSADQIYADVDFDGDITSADARLILRMSVGLEKKFNKVPDGKKIIIAVVEELPEEMPDEEPDEEDPVEKPGENELPDLSFLENMPADVAQMVFDAIDGFAGLSDDAQSGISEWIAAIKSIVAVARE